MPALVVVHDPVPVVVKNKGHKVAMLGEGGDGHTGSLLYSPQGKALARLAATPNGESTLTLFDHTTGRARAGLGVAATGEPALALLDQSGRGRAELSLDAQGKPSLALVDERGKPTAGLSKVQEPATSPK
ncbi:MAG: hypothetical protein HY268_23680 [Deltaproteobacteria bacterium]|nr:hypothetical protein [Deltaproteobacteria bacterium]